MAKNYKANKVLKKKLTEEEKEEAKIEKQNRELRAHLDREQKFSELSKARGAANHQSICKKFTLERLLNELNALIPSLNRILDKSDHDVKAIANHRDHVEEQHRRLFAFQSKIIDAILSLYNIFYDSMKKMYEEQRDQLVANFFESNFVQERIFHERKYHYENLAHANASVIKQRAGVWNEKLLNNQIQIESWSFIKRERLMEEKILRENYACREIKSIMKLFTRKLWPKDRLEEYKRVYRKEIQVDNEYKRVCENIERSQETLKELKIYLNEIEYKKLSRELELKSEQNYLLKLLKLAEKRLRVEEKNDKEKLIHLVTQTEKAKRKISTFLEKIKRIETTLKVCSKYEKINDLARVQSFDKAHDEVFQSFFYDKLAQVESDCVMLKNCKNKLTKDNQELANFISQHEHQSGLEHNYQLLNLNLTPCIGNVHQIANHIPQVKNEIKMRKLYQQHMKAYAKLKKK